jgi:Plavaka transposase
MFVGIVAGSDKTVASVATGHQEFHPLYVGPGNVDNPTRRAHGAGLMPCAFLPIPKGFFFLSSTIYAYLVPLS